MADEESISRREMLGRSLVLVGAALCAGSVLGACGDDDDGTAGGALSCDPEDAAQRAARENLHYVEASTDPNKKCTSCQLWQGGSDTTRCGRCRVLQGPINPNGTCMSWVLKQG